MFIVFEGADGVGKSTQIQLLSRHLREERGLPVEVLREPGGTRLGERVREILLDPRSGDLSAATEMFLFMAARSHLVEERILPALRRGAVVLCDRYLWSSVVYQGIAGGLGTPEVLRAGRLAAAARPDRIFILDLPAATALGRAGRRAGRSARREAGRGGGHGDRMEQKGLAFQRAVRRGFLSLARQFPRVAAVIDARGDALAVHRRLLDQLPRRGWPRARRPIGRGGRRSAPGSSAMEGERAAACGL